MARGERSGLRKSESPQSCRNQSCAGSLTEADKKVAAAEINRLSRLPCPAQSDVSQRVTCGPKLTFGVRRVKAERVARAHHAAIIVASSAVFPQEELADSMSPAHTRQKALMAAALPLLLILILPHDALGQTAPDPQSTTADSAEAHLGKGYDALKQDRYEVAAQEFRAALTLDPSLVLRAQFPLAVSLFEQHKSAQARHEFEAVRH